MFTFENALTQLDFSVLYFWTYPAWENFVAAFIVLCGFIVLRKPIGSVLFAITTQFFARFGLHLSEKSLKHLKPSFNLLPPACAFYIVTLIAPWTDSLHQGLLLVGETLGIIFIFSIFFAIASHMEIILERWKKTFSKAMRAWFEKVLEVIVVILGIVAVLEAWGIAVAPIVASLGLFGVAVALGAQDLFKNIIAGILVISEKRFNPGDWIKVSGVVEGTVEDIGFRSTLVRQFDKAPVYVPNTKFSDNPVINFSRMTHRRIFWKIGVEYSSSIDQLKEVRGAIENYILNSEDFVAPETAATFVRIDSFNNSSIDIMLYCFTNTTNWGEWLQIKEDLAYKIKEIVEGAGTAFAFPSRTVYMDFAGEAPEAFVPPSKKA